VVSSRKMRGSGPSEETWERKSRIQYRGDTRTLAKVNMGLRDPNPGKRKKATEEKKIHRNNKSYVPSTEKENLPPNSGHSFHPTPQASERREKNNET